MPSQLSHVRTRPHCLHKGVTLGQLGKSEAEIEAYNQVITRFGDATETAIRELVEVALSSKARRCIDLGLFEDAAKELRRAIEYSPDKAETRNRLGKLLLDALGDPKAALETYREALRVATVPRDQWVSHTACAFVLALFLDNLREARSHAEAALALNGGTLTPAGNALLKALLLLTETENVSWPSVFQSVTDAVQSGDPELWNDHLDDLQKLLWLIIARGVGVDFQKWM